MLVVASSESWSFVYLLLLYRLVPGLLHDASRSLLFLAEHPAQVECVLESQVPQLLVILLELLPQ